MNVRYRNKKKPGSRPEGAQAIVEFALVLPILMMMLVGILEVGRMIYAYSAINNASREAVRFGSALGYDDAGYHKYKDCAGILNMAKRSAYFMNLTAANITITYDSGPGTSTFASCDPTLAGEDPSVPVLNSGNRVVVTVRGHYKPLINLVPLPERDFTSVSARTVLGSIEVGSVPVGGPPSGGSTATATSLATSTSTSTAAPTATNTATATATAPIIIATPTFLPSSTPTLIPTSTQTATPTATFTSTATATGTSTPVSSCSSITTSDISMASNSNVVSMTITNPYTAVTVSTVHFMWNAATGASGNKTLTLQSVSLGSTFWSGLNNTSGNITLTPSSTLTIPGNNTTSTITFTFDKNYQNPITNGTTITINLSTPGCNAITKTK